MSPFDAYASPDPEGRRPGAVPSTASASGDARRRTAWSLSAASLGAGVLAVGLALASVVAVATALLVVGVALGGVALHLGPRGPRTTRRVAGVVVCGLAGLVSAHAVLGPADDTRHPSLAGPGLDAFLPRAGSSVPYAEAAAEALPLGTPAHLGRTKVTVTDVRVEPLDHPRRAWGERYTPVLVTVQVELVLPAGADPWTDGVRVGGFVTPAWGYQPAFGNPPVLTPLGSWATLSGTAVSRSTHAVEMPREALDDAVLAVRSADLAHVRHWHVEPG